MGTACDGPGLTRLLTLLGERGGRHQQRRRKETGRREAARALAQRHRHSCHRLLGLGPQGRLSGGSIGGGGGGGGDAAAPSARRSPWGGGEGGGAGGEGGGGEHRGGGGAWGMAERSESDRPTPVGALSTFEFRVSFGRDENFGWPVICGGDDW